VKTRVAGILRVREMGAVAHRLKKSGIAGSTPAMPWQLGGTELL
jgi:hypothetical protein